MARCQWLLVILFAAILFCDADLARRSTKKDFAVIAYLPEYRFYVDVNELALHLTDLIIFSVAPDARGELTYFATPSNLRTALLARETKAALQPTLSPLRLLLSVGGGGRSQHFAAVASDGARRRTFVAALLDVCEKYNLNGVDFDWESPASRQEIDAYQRLLNEAAASFSPRGLMVTVAFHPGQTLMPGGYSAVDRVHLMTYDMSFRKSGFGHHAAFDDVTQAAEWIVDMGCPVEKLAIGIPMYGRGEGKNVMETKSFAEMIDELEEAERRRKVQGDAAATKEAEAKPTPDEKLGQKADAEIAYVGADKAGLKVGANAATGGDTSPEKTETEASDEAKGTLEEEKVEEVKEEKAISKPPLIERLPPDFRARRSFDGFLFDSQLDVQRKTEHARTTGMSGVFVWEGGQDKQGKHVSLVEQIMLVANGTVVISRTHLLNGDKSNLNAAATVPGHGLGIRERLKKQKEAEEERERANAKRMLDIKAAKVKADLEEQERRRKILDREF